MYKTKIYQIAISGQVQSKALFLDVTSMQMQDHQLTCSWQELICYQQLLNKNSGKKRMLSQQSITCVAGILRLAWSTTIVKIRQYNIVPYSPRFATTVLTYQVSMQLL